MQRSEAGSRQPPELTLAPAHSTQTPCATFVATREAQSKNLFSQKKSVREKESTDQKFTGGFIWFTRANPQRTPERERHNIACRRKIPVLQKKVAHARHYLEERRSTPNLVQPCQSLSSLQFEVVPKGITQADHNHEMIQDPGEHPANTPGTHPPHLAPKTRCTQNAMHPKSNPGTHRSQRRRCGTSTRHNKELHLKR